MRNFVIFVCGVLLSVQGFAFKGGTGKRQLKNILSNQPFMEHVAAASGKTSVGINSGNLGKFFSGIASKRPIDSPTLGAKALSAIAGVAVMLGTITTADANLEKRAKVMDKKILSTKVVDIGDGVELNYNGTLGGNYFNGTGKPDTLSIGVGLGAELSRDLSSLDVKGSFRSTRTKEVGEGANDGWSGDEDYIVRGIFVQGIPVTDSNLNPVLYIDGGYAHYGNKKRSADGTVGIGVGAEGVLFGNKMQLQLRGGFGILGEGQHDPVRDEFNEIDDNTVFAWGATLKTGWTSLGDILQAGDDSIAHIIPIIPAAVTTFTEFRPVGGDADFDIHTRRVESTINVIQGLGVTLTYDGTKGQEAAKSALLSFTYGF